MKTCIADGRRFLCIVQWNETKEEMRALLWYRRATLAQEASSRLVVHSPPSASSLPRRCLICLFRPTEGPAQLQDAGKLEREGRQGEER